MKICIDGNSPEIFLNMCMRNGVHIWNVYRVSGTEIIFCVSGRDLDKVQQFAGNRYKIRVKGHKGLWYRCKSLLRRKSFLAGIIIFAGLICYQSFFVSEIQVDGYESVSEQAIRNSLKEAGLYEGCRKSVDLNKVKMKLYEDYDKISWVGITYDGNLACVSIAEGGELYVKLQVSDDKPCNIVADKDGYIASVVPKEGMRQAEDGNFVKKGDVIISGEIPLTGTVYGTDEEGESAMYVHAEGSVKAKVPVHLEFYCPAYETVKESERGKLYWISINENDFIRSLVPFENSTVKYINLINAIKPFRLKLQLICIENASIKKVDIPIGKIKKQVLNEIHKYTEENLPEDTEILNKSLNFSREKNIIKVSVTLETLQQIGVEEEIVIDNSNGKSEKDDDQ